MSCHSSRASRLRTKVEFSVALDCVLETRITRLFRVASEVPRHKEARERERFAVARRHLDQQHLGAFLPAGLE